MPATEKYNVHVYRLMVETELKVTHVQCTHVYTVERTCDDGLALSVAAGEGGGEWERECGQKLIEFWVSW